MTEPIVRTVNLTKVYGSGETAVRALDRVDLVVPSSQFQTIMANR